MAATEIKQIAPSTMDMEDPVNFMEVLNRDGLVKTVPSEPDMEGP